MKILIHTSPKDEKAATMVTVLQGRLPGVRLMGAESIAALAETVRPSLARFLRVCVV